MPKKILFFFPENPFSNRAGNVTRAKTTLTILKKLGHRIDLVGVKNIYQDMQDTNDFDENIVDNLFFINPKPPKRKTTTEYWKYKILKAYNKSNPSNPSLTAFMQKEFKSIFSKGDYDTVIINYEFWADLLDPYLMKNVLKIVDTHDWITLNEFYKRKSLNVGRRFNEEINNLSKFDKIVTISNEEYFVFSSFLGNRVMNIPPSFPTHFTGEKKEKKYDLIFTGSDNPFNIEGIKWFLNNVFPSLPKTIKVCIVGRVCKHIPDYKNITKVDFAEELSSYYTQSRIAICPMLKGTGIKIKVVEALSYGLPIVGTERAIDGFSSKSDNGCMVNNDPDVFKQYIMTLLLDMTYYETMEKRAKDYFKNNFSEEKAVQEWKNLIK